MRKARNRHQAEFFFTMLDPGAKAPGLGRPLAVSAEDVRDRLAEGFVILDVAAKGLLPIGNFDTQRAQHALWAWRGRMERVQRDAADEGADGAVSALMR